MRAINFDERLLTTTLDTSLQGCPFFERFAPAARHAIRVLHGVPDLFDDITRQEMEVYFGRTAATPNHVRGRFGVHRREKRHRWGVVLFRCSTSQVQIWERATNRLVKRLDAQGSLCVANATAGGQGPLPEASESCIYMTWRRRRRRKCTPISVAKLDALARAVHGGDLGLSIDSVRRGIRAVADPGDRLRVRWA